MPSKRKAEDDFILTLSDNDESYEQEPKLTVQPDSPPRKKAKKGQDSQARYKKDDDALDSDFEFAVEDIGGVTDDFEGWGFEGAKPAIGAVRKGVDLDEIIRRRKAKQEKAVHESNGVKDTRDAIVGASEDEEEGLEEEATDDEEVVEVGGLTDEEEDISAQGDELDEDMDEPFDEEDDKLSDGMDEASDDDSVATREDHPDDETAETGSEMDDQDAEEQAKQAAFFAPEDKTIKSESKDSFQFMSLSRPILRGLATVGFNKPTPIQSKTIPIALMGKDVVGGAVTGSGKTAAFVVPILERLLYRPKKIPTSRVVILTPTRELAIQCHAVATKLSSHTDIKFCLAVGGLSLKAQETELRLRPDVIIATPGRFIDHMRNSASFSIDSIEIIVLDEADRMLEDGFADELNEILTTLPKSRQSMLFSATMTSSVDNLIRVGLNKPVRIMVDAQKQTVSTLTQEFIRLRPGREEKRMGYLLYICTKLYRDRVIVFFRQKKTAHEVRILFGLFGLSCAELHGSMNQQQRISSVEDFRDGKVSYLLATDLASRGLDIKGVDTVINYEAPQTLEIYLHRVGRTARAGRSGVAVTLASEADRKVVKAAVKAGKAQSAKISSRIIEASDADGWQKKVDEMIDEVEIIMQEEKEEKSMAQVEMQVQRGENLIRHEDEIKSRPKRTWFESESDKAKAKDAGRIALNGVGKLKAELSKKSNGRLSNKDMKKIDAKSSRSDSRSWKKGRAERDGKGAVLDLPKGSKARPKVPATRGKAGAGRGGRSSGPRRRK